MSRLKTWGCCLALFVTVFLSGCVSAPLPPAQQEVLMEKFRNGEAVLDCYGCGLRYGFGNEAKANSLYNTGQWRELALLIMQDDSRFDIGYFYLGRAAEELGYPKAADRYYVYAVNLARGFNRAQTPGGIESPTICAELSAMMCNGVNVSQDGFVRLRALRLEAARQEALLHPPAPMRSPTRTATAATPGSTTSVKSHGSPTVVASGPVIKVPQTSDQIEILDPPPAVR